VTIDALDADDTRLPQHPDSANVDVWGKRATSLQKFDPNLENELIPVDDDEDDDGVPADDDCDDGDPRVGALLYESDLRER
jgi:hypothetical protein